MRHSERRDQDRTASHHAPPAPRRETGVAAEILALQRIVGNEAVAEIMAEQPEIQRFTAHDVLRRSGSPLPDSVRGDMESRLGADFSTVRVHTGAAAEQSATELGARAYTSGEHIVLGAGAGDPHTLAHELSHVIQQRSGPVAGTDNGGGLAVSDPSDAFERAAEASANRALSGAAPTAHPAHASGQRLVHRPAHVQRQHRTRRQALERPLLVEQLAGDAARRHHDAVAADHHHAGEIVGDDLCQRVFRPRRAEAPP